ncbi:NAD-dependent epimerase/dehydratase family protein [Williamsia maris]|uniref:Nucleoside-diphosphate-sugar epimerase n=1 Tax=Williamsia maris TaxID=72806 RepID=A0ABT1HCS3_9NOCA|nr:NAD(P)-dependent oxidoreductase [Williamsia maris]MCP2175520.1 Nucleoside-diphosphate-sugar epimerase [Williamsia maris]
MTTTSDSTETPSGSVVVTGACGLVGTAVVSELLSRGRHVVATDLDTVDNRRAATTVTRRGRRSPGSVEFVWADLADQFSAAALVSGANPVAVIHLAAIIPPFCYANPAMAYRVNVMATDHLVAAADQVDDGCRFILASSVAVYGPRNPHSTDDLLTPATPLSPVDVYGHHKTIAERIVRDARSQWLILRLGGVLDDHPNLQPNGDLTTFDRMLPGDGRLQTVSVGDVARAFAAATETPVVGRCFLIGGDDSHRIRHQDVAHRVSAAMGLPGVIADSALGDPTDDGAWFATDWMDTSEAQHALRFQTQTFPDVLAVLSSRMGWRRHLLRCVAPLVANARRRFVPDVVDPSQPVNPWAAASAKWGDTSAVADYRTDG